MFSKNKKIAPALSKNPEPKRNNFFSSAPEKDTPYPEDTFYLCMPGKPEFFIDKLLVNLSIKIVAEQVQIERHDKEIDDTAKKINQKHAELLNNYSNERKQQSIQMQIESLNDKLKQLYTDRDLFKEQVTHFIPSDDYYKTPAEAILSQVKIRSQHDLVLVKINLPIDKFNIDISNHKEVTRPNLISSIDTITGIPKEQAARIVTAAKELAKKPQHSGAIDEVVDDILKDNKEYTKTIIVKPNAPSKLESKPGTLVVNVDSAITVVFQEGKKSPSLAKSESQENSPRSRRR
jgi:hypothetical protein